MWISWITRVAMVICQDQDHMPRDWYHISSNIGIHEQIYTLTDTCNVCDQRKTNYEP